MFPLDQQGPSNTPDETDMLQSLIGDFFSQARTRMGNQDLSGVFNDMLTAVHNQPPPAKETPPPRFNQYGSLGATFASTLAEQLGAKGAVAAHEDRVQKNETQRREVEQRNIDRENEYHNKQALQELQIRMKINEARAEQMKQLGDLDEYEARLKTGAALRKELEGMREKAKMKEISATNSAILERVISGIHERGKEARATLDYKKVIGTALDDKKFSDAIKVWANGEKARILARDSMTGEWVNTPEKQQEMLQGLYQEMLTKQADENHPDTNEGDFFDSIFKDDIK